MKSKKVLTILLSLAIMVTFMPTLAFAVDGDTNHTAHNWKEDKASSIVADKCGSYGVKAEICDATKLGQKCEEVKYTAVKKPHDPQQVKMNLTEYYAAIANQTEGDAKDKADAVTAAKNGLTALAANYRDEHGLIVPKTYNDICYLFVQQCKDCGKVNVKYVDGVEDVADPTLVLHKKTAPTVNCKDDVCSVCGAKIVASTHHDRGDTTETYRSFCGSTDNIKTVTKCTTCGDAAESEFVYPTADDKVYNVWKGHNWGTKIDVSTTEKKAEADKKVAAGLAVAVKVGPADSDVEYYETTVVKEPTCAANGASILICKDCGLRYDPNPSWTSYSNVIGDIQSVFLNNSTNYREHHATAFRNSYEDCLITVPNTSTKCTNTHYEVAATCNYPGYSFDLCDVCGTRTNVRTSGQAIGHSYEVVVLKEPTCEFDGITVIKCKNCGRELLAGTDVRVGRTKNVGDLFEGTDKKIYLVAGSTESATGNVDSYVEVADWEHKGHKLGAYEEMAAANCTTGNVQAEKCSVCGHYDIQNAKETAKALGHTIEEVVVPATCGAKGYTYKVCTTCEKYAPQNAKTGDTTAVGYTDELVTKYDYTDPKVQLGAKCSFEWGTLDDETDAMICTVCGAVLEGSETPKTDDAKKALQVEKAKPTIEAAANILSNSAKYTDASVKAIEEAKANLNSAIAAGTSTDVKNMAAELENAVNAVVEKAANSVKAKGKKVTVKANKKTKKVAKTKTFKKAVKASNAAGKVTFKKANKKGGNKIVVKSNGNVVVKKGLKKGTYKVAVTASAAGDGKTLPGTASATVTVVIK